MRWFWLFALCYPLGSALAQPEAEAGANPGEIFPRAASLKRGEVNVRSGPGTQYPILWIYWRAGYPVALVARFDNYLKIRDFEGEEGWVHQAMVSKRVTALVNTKEPARLLKKPAADSRAVARLGNGVLVALTEPCTDWCSVEVIPSGEEGYLRPADLELPTPEALQNIPQ
jgi:SH3-like domain-containing protein